MASALHSICTVLVTAEYLVGILGNGFITLVNGIDWLKKQKISTADQILTALAISRIYLILVMMLSWFAVEIELSAYIDRNKIILMSIVWTVANHFNIWLAAGLSVFYFLKIADFSNSIFFHLKHRVETVVLGTLLGALVCLPFNLALSCIYIDTQIHAFERNMTMSSQRSDIENFSKLTSFTVGSFIPFSTSLNVSLLLIFSLWKHLKNMKCNTTFRDPSFKAHIRAMKIVTSFLLLFAIYILTLFITTFNFRVARDKSVFMLGQIISNVYASGHSLILILGNNKLRKASLSVLRQLPCG